MYVFKNRGYTRHYIYGGSGLFDSLANLLSSSLASNTVKQLASTAMDVGKKVAIDVGKSAATNLGKKMTEKILKSAAKKPIVKAISQKPIVKTVLKTPTAQKTIQKLNEKSKDILNKYINPTPTPTSSSLIDGGAISIQDYIRKMNGAGLKAV